MAKKRPDLLCPKCKHPLSLHSDNHGDYNSCDGPATKRGRWHCHCEMDREDILRAEIDRLTAALRAAQGER